MRVETITRKLFTFDELTERAKEKARDWYRSGLEFYDELVIDDVKEALEKIGFDSVEIGFSGFCSQGDGAHFTGNYLYKKGALAVVKKEYPQWGELHSLAKELQALERKHFYSIRFSIEHSGRYSHENCTIFDFEDIRNNHRYTNPDFLEQPFKDCCRSFMRDIYSLLENDYNYQNSDSAVDEIILSNGYEFSESGDII
jgi:hypothetical protein